jgi:hypothetical protein
MMGRRSTPSARCSARWGDPGDDAPEQDLDLVSVWPRLRDLRLRRVEVFMMTRGVFDDWNRSLGTLAEIVASTGVVVHGG